MTIKFSPRETEVLNCLARSLTTEQIAAEMCIQRSTVVNHIGNLFAKTGTHNRLELVNIARALGVFTDWPDSNETQHTIMFECDNCGEEQYVQVRAFSNKV